MSFLFPWYLLGALAVGGPILFHLLRRAARERTAFSSLLFLNPTPPRVRRRRRLEHWWLLALRCLCLLLLTAAFARPYFTRSDARATSARPSHRRLLLLDTSASMRRAGAWDKARALAERYLAGASPRDQVALATFDRSFRMVFSFKEWIAWTPDQRETQARGRLAAVSPGWMGTDLGRALTAAAEQFDEEGAGEKIAPLREIILITDLQEGARLEGLQGHEWPSHLQVIVERVATRPQSNAGLEVLEPSSPIHGGTAGIQVRVANASDSTADRFHVGWNPGAGAIGASMEIYLPPGQTRTFAAPPLPAGWSNGVLRLSGDKVDFDNASCYAAPSAERVWLAYLGSEPAGDPAGLLYYLMRVFPASARREVRFSTPATNGSLSIESLNQALFAVIPAALAPQSITAAREWLAGGHTALLVLKDPDMAPTLAGLLGVPQVDVADASGDYALLAQVDFSHPIFSPFADPRYSDFTHIHFWKHRRWEIPPAVPARVLARFDDGSPALAEVDIGRGRLLVLASGWAPADSQLAVSSKFVPLMQRILDWSGGDSPGRCQFHTGDALPSPATEGAEVQWRRPDGTGERLAAGLPFGETSVPGIYFATWGARVRQYAVNLPLEESRTAPRLPDDLARLGVPMKAPDESPVAQAHLRMLHLQRDELENREKLWRGLIVAALAVVLGEILLGGALARRVKTADLAR